VHKQKLLHRTSGVLIFRDKIKEEILVQQRSSNLHCPNMWTFVSGHVASGESYYETAKKELQEEMFHGKDLPEIELKKIFKIRKNADNDPEFLVLYEGIYDGKFYPNPCEVQDYKYVKVIDMKKDILENPGKYTGTFVEVMKKYYSDSSSEDSS